MPAEKTEFEIARKKRRRRLSMARTVRLFVAGAIVAIVFLAIYWAIKIDLAGIIGDRLAVGAPGGSFPLEISGTTVHSVFPCGGNIGVLTDTSYQLFSPSGGELLSEQHGMTNPAVSSMGRRFVIFDRGGNSLIVRTRDRILFENTFPHSIIDASVSQDGLLTVVTSSQRFSSQVVVYDADFSGEIFNWSSGAYVLFAGVSPDGHTVAAVSVGARRGDIYSTVHILSVDAPEELAKRQFESVLPLNVSFTRSGDIKLICDKLFAVVSKDGAVLGKNAFTSRLLSFSSPDDNGNTVLVFDKYTELRSGEAVFINELGEVVSNAMVEGEVRGVSASGGRVAIYTPDNISLFATDGTPLGVCADSPEVLHASLVDSDVYAVSRNSLFAPKFETIIME